MAVVTGCYTEATPWRESAYRFGVGFIVQNGECLPKHDVEDGEDRYRANTQYVGALKKRILLYFVFLF